MDISPSVEKAKFQWKAPPLESDTPASSTVQRLQSFRFRKPRDSPKDSIENNLDSDLSHVPETPETQLKSNSKEIKSKRESLTLSPTENKFQDSKRVKRENQESLNFGTPSNLISDSDEEIGKANVLDSSFGAFKSRLNSFKFVEGESSTLKATINMNSRSIEKNPTASSESKSVFIKKNITEMKPEDSVKSSPPIIFPSRKSKKAINIYDSEEISTSSSGKNKNSNSVINLDTSSDVSDPLPFINEVNPKSTKPKVTQNIKEHIIIPDSPEATSNEDIDRLKIMFPLIEDKIILNALKNANNNIETAVEALLFLSPKKNSSAGNSNGQLSKTSESNVNKPKVRKIVFSDDEESDDDTLLKIIKQSDVTSNNDVSSSTSEEIEDETFILSFFNDAPVSDLQDMTQMNDSQLSLLLNLRPFESMDHLRELITSTKGLTHKIIQNYESNLEVYRGIDRIVASCEAISKDVMQEIKGWVSIDNDESKINQNEGALDLVEISKGDTDLDSSELLRVQPSFVPDDLQLKSYQLLGISWLLVLNKKNLSGILADDMGLGKTAQVICFLGILKQKGINGPHLIVVPSSTTNNWLREISRWCPDLETHFYYGSKSERMELQSQLLRNRKSCNVVVTSYNMMNSKEDRSFLRKMKFNYMILDEGHFVKNPTTQRYKNLMSIRSQFRLLMTGTPLQNNLQELMALLTFVMPELFENEQEVLNSAFNLKVTSTSGSIPTSRIISAKQMLTPFILRRKKAQVLKDLPAKSTELVYCEPTPYQKKMYKRLMAESSKAILTEDRNLRTPVLRADSTNKLSNIMMQLRKMACHPLLHRCHFDSTKCRKMANLLISEPEYFDANVEFIYEDMMVLSDFDLHGLCMKFKRLSSFGIPKSLWLESGKTMHLFNELLPYHFSENNRILLFSQFTSMLDILEYNLKNSSQKYNFIRMDGQTPVPDRQELMDRFTNDDTIFIFLLSTKAAGCGLNLAVANVVILYDLDFNPHNDAQAEDRAHRVGQTRTVLVQKMITKETIEENIYKCGQRKLQLDRSVSGANVEDEDGPIADNQEELLDATSIMEILRAELLIDEPEQE